MFIQYTFIKYLLWVGVWGIQHQVRHKPYQWSFCSPGDTDENKLRARWHVVLSALAVSGPWGMGGGVLEQRPEGEPCGRGFQKGVQHKGQDGTILALFPGQQGGCCDQREEAEQDARM